MTSEFYCDCTINRFDSSPILPQHKLQITLPENQINKSAEITGFLTRLRKILPYPLVISLLWALGKDSNAETLQDIYRKFNKMTGLNVSRHQPYSGFIYCGRSQTILGSRRRMGNGQRNFHTKSAHVRHAHIRRFDVGIAGT